MRIPFYFDYACPWAYLGSCRVESYFRDLGCEVELRPVQLSVLKEPSAGQGAAPGPRKKANFGNDLRHWAEMVGAEFGSEARSPVRSDTQLALRSMLVALDEGRGREFHYPAYRARWAEGRDLADPDTLRDLLSGAGLDGEAALERARSEELGARLERDTQEAIGRGVFGVPTLFVGDRMFWGNDRFELARYFVQKTRRA